MARRLSSVRFLLPVFLVSSAVQSSYGFTEDPLPQMPMGDLLSDIDGIIDADTYCSSSSSPGEPCAVPHWVQCCSSLSKAEGLGGKVYWAHSDMYAQRMSSYWSVSAALDPWWVVQPSNASDTSTVMKTLVAGNCTFGIRGGGHGSWPGQGSVSDGVTIDFGNMNAVSYNAETKIASIEPGGHWQEVYDALAPHGVCVAGGRAGTVGVGGFITGGGNSFHSGSHGMACDTVTNFEVVLADGSVVNANATDNADLWVALKGGSSNFGLVTRFDMAAVEFPDPARPDIWGGSLMFDLASQAELVDAFVDFGNNAHKDDNSTSLVYWAYIPAIGGMIINLAVENTLGVEKPPAFDGYYNVNGMTADMTSVDPPTTTMARRGPDAVMGLAAHAAARGNGVLFSAAAMLSGGADQEALAAPLVRAFVDDVEAYAERIGAGWGWRYVNYANGEQEPFAQASVGAAALAKMRAASRRYDPDGVFQRLRRCGFKIPMGDGKEEDEEGQGKMEL